MRRHPSWTKLPFAGLLRRMLRDTRAATAIEYGLIVSLVVIAMIASFMTVADTTTGMWNNISSKVSNAR